MAGRVLWGAGTKKGPPMGGIASPARGVRPRGTRRWAGMGAVGRTAVITTNGVGNTTHAHLLRARRGAPLGRGSGRCAADRPLPFWLCARGRWPRRDERRAAAVAADPPPSSSPQLRRASTTRRLVRVFFRAAYRPRAARDSARRPPHRGPARHPRRTPRAARTPGPGVRQPTRPAVTAVRRGAWRDSRPPRRGAASLQLHARLGGARGGGFPTSVAPRSCCRSRSPLPSPPPPPPSSMEAAAATGAAVLVGGPAGRNRGRRRQGQSPSWRARPLGRLCLVLRRSHFRAGQRRCRSGGWCGGGSGHPAAGLDVLGCLSRAFFLVVAISTPRCPLRATLLPPSKLRQLRPVIPVRRGTKLPQHKRDAAPPICKQHRACTRVQASRGACGDNPLPVAVAG